MLQKASGLSNSASAQVFDAGGGTAGSRSCRRPHFGGNGRAGAASPSKSARTYLERVFQKTGTHQQSQLLAMLKTLQPLATAGAMTGSCLGNGRRQRIVEFDAGLP
ncbi:hypothetical protein FJW07_02725 [Mesorhizobium sp. B3-1-9]|uniref:hypothetical protein n=1 Tax=Mesorhizobium sp. B3-1-9 TaxID=2589892 RepID=UPI00112D432D|nr:hypothetical protein [Mesorhizobium sp. B3-1-9]TPI42868.1 hypothetical protein FJW07_02725 [Mesorhizobium sp. B3-1-9]